MFSEPISRTYDMHDASWEIILMLAVAFALGYLLRYLTHSCTTSESAAHVNVPAKYAAFKHDDLKIVEGIGPKIEELLQKNGIHTWSDLSHAKADALRDILKSGGDRFAMHDPKSWPDQAHLADEGKWKDLEEFQDLLLGGRA